MKEVRIRSNIQIIVNKYKDLTQKINQLYQTLEKTFVVQAAFDSQSIDILR